MNRRGFLGALAGAIAAAADPELVAWRPGAKVFTFGRPLVDPPWISLEWTPDLLRYVERSLVFHRNAFVLYDPAGRPVFRPPGQKIGDTVTVRMPARFRLAAGVKRS